MGLLERHARLLKRNVRAHGRSVIITDLSDTDYPVIVLFNDVQNVLKMDNSNDPVMGDRIVAYIDRDSLQTDAGEIKPAKGWTLTGSPNIYDADENYVMEIPKQDKQLPGFLIWLSKQDSTAVKYPDDWSE